MIQEEHAELSPSGSERWLKCAGSVKAQKKYKDTYSEAADYGTKAHELAESCFIDGCDAHERLNAGIDNCDIVYVQEYLDYVNSFRNLRTIFRSEHYVYFGGYAGFMYGTLDAVVVDYENRTAHIFDLKFGKGIKVDAYKNSQLMLYALGIYEEFGFLDDITTFVLHIVQPRISNTNTYELRLHELLMFAGFAKHRSELASGLDPARTAGDIQCRWCKARNDCKELANFANSSVPMDLFDAEECDRLMNKNAIELTDTEKRNILDNKTLVERFLKDLSSSVLETIKSGENFEGYDLGKSRRYRKWNADAEDTLFEKLGEKAYKKTLLGITQAQKTLTKQELEELTFKTPGKDVLVKSDVVDRDIVCEFDNLDFL